MSDASIPSRSPNAVRLHPFEALLRLCAQAAPEPWYPRLHAQATGVPLEILYSCLENLWLDGLVQKAEGTPETGPGLTLAPAGREVLNDSAALQRLRDGRPVIEGSQGGLVREAIRRPPRPTATWGLVSVSLAVFACGLVMAMMQGVGLDAFLMGDGRALPVLETLGVMRGDDWMRGEWWRLATSSFVCVGFLHLAFSLLALYRIGGRAEQMWGQGRFLLLYLLSGIGASCTGLAMNPGDAWRDGAWGAICGLMAATGVWVLCNNKHLPRAVASSMRTQLAVDAVVLGLFSVLLGRWDDLGGALVGAGVALVLHVQRFGPWPWNWAILSVLLPLPWLGYTFIEHERMSNPAWQALFDVKEEKDFEGNYLKRINKSTQDAYNAYHDEGAILVLAPEKRDKDKIKSYKEHLVEQHDNIKDLAEDLSHLASYKDPIVEKARGIGVDYVQATEVLLAAAIQCLREGDEWNAEQEAKAKKVRQLKADWQKLLK